MMSPQLMLLIALTIVSWINALERCVDCNLLTTKEASDIARPAGCNADCFLQEQTKPEVFTPWSKLGPILQFDDTGIYYEPAELLAFEQVVNIPQPFYILNPAYQANHKGSRSAVKLDEITESTPLPLNKHVSKSRHIKLDKHRKKEETGHKKSEKQLKNHPFYLDIDVQEPRTETRGSPVVETHSGDLKLAEQYLSVCLDLHVVEFYRKNNSAFKNLKDVWDYPKFHYYQSMSDFDLEKEIIKKCNHSIDIVKKSLDEIKETWPKKINLSFSFTRDFPIKARNGDEINHGYSEDIILKSSPRKKISNPINVSYTEKSTVDWIPTNNKLIYPNIVNDSVLRILNPYYNAGSQFQPKVISPVEKLHLEVTAATIVGSSSTLAKTNSDARVIQHPMGQETVQFPNFYVEDNLHLNSSYDPGNNHIDDNAELSGYTNTSQANTSYTNSKIYYIPMNQRNINLIFKDVQTVYDVTTPVMTEYILTESVADNENYAGSFTTSYPKNYNIQVSEVVTKEYPNDTVISVIEGFQNSFLKNNSTFVERYTTADYVTSDTPTPMMTSIAGETSEINKIESEKLTIGDSFTGNLYFLYKNHSVPARFIQHKDGKINVGLDGYSVCDSANDTTVKSILLSVLCNCIRFKNCTNRSR